ncbi:mechanosensitive ion channel [Candidatus Parcubacteria bacterium]|nr:mechanosensitive ion channel [Candidatus Parcubacteria bacterium]
MDIKAIIDIFQQNPLLIGGVKIIGIIIATLLTNRFGLIFINKLIKRLVNPSQKKTGPEEEKKSNTLISILGGTMKFVVGIIAALMVLSEIGIDIGPVLAGAGLIGLAVGMASKEIISDFLSGFFIILEDQYHIGDRVKIAGVEGEVKEVTLRRTTIKDDSGLLHSIPNGQIKTIARKVN